MEDAAPEQNAKKRNHLKDLGVMLVLCHGPFLLVLVAHVLLHFFGVVPTLNGLARGYVWCLLAGVALSILYQNSPKARHAGLMIGLSAFATFGVLSATVALNFKAVKVEGNSMQPYLQPGDVLLVDLTEQPGERYGIYTLNLPDGDHAHVIKRLVGLPGEDMDVRYGRVFADEAEVYPRNDTASDTWNDQRPANARFYSGPRDNGEGYFVLGDNPPDSRDSRHFGALDADAFEGRVVWSLRGSRGFGPLGD